MQCVNKNLREFQTLKKQSGLSDFVLSAYVGKSLDELNRYPYLDELPNANSEEAIKEDLKLNKDNITNTENILQATNTKSVEEAVQTLNNKYRDKEIEVLEVGSKTKVYITTRPTLNSEIGKDTDNENVNDFQYFNDVLDKLQSLYGIDIIPISNDELSKDEWREIVGVNQVKAFIYNGNIYLNTDIATVDSPVHEFLHLLFGSMRYQNRELYDQLVSQSENFDTFGEISELYPNRTRGDINEEVFVTELAKYLTGQKSAINKLDDASKKEIIYNVNRTLDTILMGDVSVKCVSDPHQLNLKTLAKLVNSTSMNNNFRGSINDAKISRIMANTKSDLIKKGELREECE